MQETIDRLLSLREVEAILGLGRTTLYRMAKSGELCPRKIRRRLGYLQTDVQLYMKSLPIAAQKSSAEVKDGRGSPADEGPVLGEIS